MRPIMYDAELTIKMLSKMGKEIVGAMEAEEIKEQRQLLQKLLNDLGFLYDILHLSDISDIQMIDIHPNK